MVSLLLVLMLMLAIIASTPLHGSAADAGGGAQIINKAPNPVHIFRKSINGDDANSQPGPFISQGTPITWTYYVENVGSASLSNLHITDDNGTPDYADDDFTVCIIDKLNNNKSETCSYSGTFQLGPYGNVATLTAEPPSGPMITDQDPAHYFGYTTGPSITIQKFTNGQDADQAPGPEITVGEAVTWTYQVYNTGDVALTDLEVMDDNGTQGNTSDDFQVCTRDSLDPLDGFECTIHDTALPGQYQNVGSASGSYNTTQVTDNDVSHYIGLGASIDLEKSTNGQDADSAPGPYIAVGDPVTWEYIVSNDGRLALSNISVTDDQGVSISCPQTSLAVDEQMTCSASGTASAGQYANIGTATGTPPGGLDNVSDTDHSHYFGAQPSIHIEKHTNGLDADASPGPYVPEGSTVTWEYIVSNDGNLALSNVSVTDDQGVSISCPQTSLEVGEQMTCSASGTAAAGQYANIGTASANPPGGLAGVSDTDPSHYFGVSDPPQPMLDLQKFTFGLDADTAPGPSVPVGETVTWTYAFTNTGNLTLFDVSVTDDNGTPGDNSDDFTVCTINSLDPDASDSCSDNGTASAGQYTNLGTVSGTYPGVSSAVSDSDPSNYFGVSDPMQPALDLQKFTFGLDADTAPGPSVPVGETVSWTYTFTNTGNLTLFNVSVTDDNGTPSDAGDDFTVCTINSLDPDDFDSCSDSDTASVGQYTNLGTVSGTYPGGSSAVSDSDPSNYFGVSDPSQPALALQKFTNGLDADTAPGPYVPVGETVTWTYTFTNTGNLTLFDISVTDDNGTSGDNSDDVIVCTIPFLDPDASDSCSDSRTASAGQYTNLGTVSGTYPGGYSDVSDSDSSNYFGVSDQQISITLQKYSNGLDADTAPGLYVLVGNTVTWTYIFTNTGSVPLSDVTITDDNGTPGDTSDDFTVCTTASLAPDASDTCSSSGPAVADQYTNLGTATGTPPAGLDNVSATDPSNYFGVSDELPSLTLQKHTNGQDADTAPGPYVPVGEPVTWAYAFSNIGTVTLSDVTITDDNGTPGDTSDDVTVCTIDSLAPYASDSCSASGTAAAGQYTNLGTAKGTPPGGLSEVSASDPSNYFGAQPSINIEKHTNGQDADTAPGLSIPVGDSVTWEYIISNNGNVSLSDIEVVDDQLGSICAPDPLDAGASTTCQALGLAVLGQYKNVATVTATPPGNLTDVQGEDSSHYLGYSPVLEIELQKSTNGFDADSAPGPTLTVGYNVSWDFTITNPGDETITYITIIDDNGTPDDESDDITVCTLESLAPLDLHTCTLHGKVQEGQYANVGTVTGYLNEKMVSSSDPSHYFGKFPLLYLSIIFRNGTYP